MAVNGALILDPTGLPRRRVPGTPGPAAGSRGGHLPPRTPQAEGGRGEASPDRQGLCWTVRLSLRALVRESCWVSNRRRLSGWTEPASEAASFPAGIPPAALWQVGQWLGSSATPYLPRWKLLVGLVFARTKDRPCWDGILRLKPKTWAGEALPAGLPAWPQGRTIIKPTCDQWGGWCREPAPQQPGRPSSTLDLYPQPWG